MSALVGLFWLAFLAADPASGRTTMEDLQVALDGRRVKVSFRLDGAFTEPLLERVESGLPTGFVFDLRLVKDHPRWWDKELDETRLQVAAMYDAVNREYLVNYKQDGRLTDSRVVHDLAELERAMCTFREVPVFTLGEIPPRWRLLVKARASLGSRNLLSLIPTTVTTDWVESRKFRVR